MKDIFDYLCEQDEDLGHLPRTDLLESEKQDVLHYIRARTKEITGTADFNGERMTSETERKDS